MTLVLPGWAEGAIKFDGLDAAVIGVGWQSDQAPLLVYDADKIAQVIRTLIDGDAEDVDEYINFNVRCLYAGNRTPIIMERLDGVE